MAKVEVKGLRFFAFHGCHEEEAKVGGKFEVDITVFVDVRQVATQDDIQKAVNYVNLMDMAQAQMKIRCHLIETVAMNIANAISEAHNQAESIEVTVRKLNPPVLHDVDHVSVTVSI